MRIVNRPLWLPGLLSIVGCVALLGLVNINVAHLRHGTTAAIAELVITHSLLPRVAMSLLCGAGLALAGLLFQQVLRNPLAEPASLGIAAGANLAMSVALAFVPGLLVLGLPTLALLGAAGAALLLWRLVSGQRFAPLNVILAGMVIGLYANALNTLLILFHHDFLSDLFAWQAGSLSQNGWSSSLLVATTLLLCAGASAWLIRGLTVLGLSDSSAQALGISVAALRGLTLAVSVVLSAVITSQVGIIGFIGLAAPALVRACGARRFAQQWISAPLVGALLLALVDQLAQYLSPAAGDLPAGALTALLSAPLLLVMLLRQRSMQLGAATETSLRVRRFSRRDAALLLALLLLATLGALLLNRMPPGADGYGLLSLRWPRVLGALIAGAMLAGAGVMIQRLMRNPMASPELLGISSGASLAVMLGVILANAAFVDLYAAAFAGSAIVVIVLLWLGARSRFTPDKMVLIGLCLTHLASALSLFILLSGDPRAMLLLNWSTGSTSGISAGLALSALAAWGFLTLLALLMRRWMVILALGETSAQALGLRQRLSYGALLLVAAALTACATLLVGPLSFVGLMAPQLARFLGARSFRCHYLTAALVGALLMVTADWLGRNIAWPWPVSAGLLTAFLGAPWFLWLLGRAGNRAA